MPFLRDHGTWCIVLPLKLGVGITTMIAFSHSIVCILAILTGDIRFQANGYNLSLYQLPSIVGSIGLLIGFIGLLGVYDDKPILVKVFNYWLAAKILAMLVTAIADYWTLRKCDSWLNTTEHLTAGNVQLDKLAELHVCPWARWAYIAGAGIDIAAWCYLLARSLSFQWQLERNPPYAINFGREPYDKEARWKLYQVKDPIRDRKRTSLDRDESSYGTMAEQPGMSPEADQEIEAPYEIVNGQQVPRRRPGGGAGDRPAYNPDGTQAGAGLGEAGFAPAPRDASEMVPL